MAITAMEVQVEEPEVVTEPEAVSVLEVVTELEAAEVPVADRVILLETEKHYLNLNQIVNAAMKQGQ